MAIGSIHKNSTTESHQPLLRQSTINPTENELTPAQKAISQTFKSTENLAKLLPTGTLLTFQLLSPLLSNNGNCYPINRIMTFSLVLFCSLSCFLLSFTDSFRDAGGVVRYGFVTLRGMWVIDGTAQLPIEEAEGYKIKFIDFLHGFMSVLVFVAVALLHKDFVSCFYPVLTEEMEQIVASLPVGIGVVASGFFVAFPTTRHGIGFPLSAR